MKHILRPFYSSIGESLHSVLPICAIVLLLSISLAPIMPGVMVMFLFGALLIIFGMSVFTIGSNISMEPLGDGIGVMIGKSKKTIFPMLICFLVGFLITIAEPDLTVLAEKVTGIENMLLIMLVALGVGLFLALAFFRLKKKIPLSWLLVVLYAIALALAILPYIPGLNIGSQEFIPTAFDSGGVTTGPITVPFIMALGAGMASMRKGKSSSEDSFGLVALCSIGPILSVLVLSLIKSPGATNEVGESIDYLSLNTKQAFMCFLDPDTGILKYIKEVAVAFLPIVGMFIIFQLITRRFNKTKVLRICVGFVYTYIGLVLFLTGANVGFMPAGELIGKTLAGSSFKWALVPIGMVLGYFVVAAEPAVHTLKKQVEEVTNGAISQKSIGIALSVGVSVSVGISMIRVLTGMSILPVLIIGYIIPLIITFFVPKIYTGIAFDSGGVASGPMATTFILPFAIGACQALGGNVLTDAFGIVAMIAMTPLITIQVLGLIGKTKQDRHLKRIHSEIEQIDDGIVYYEEDYDEE